ncbi:hypothetical protein ACLKA6_018081 [Drosophila palustris]
MVTYACGGVIISKRSILTAAHCIMRNFLGLIIYFGANRSTGQQRMIVEPRNIVVHPEYNSNTMFNDIALIKLPVDLAFNAYIQPAKLPAPSQSYDNENAIVSGWGVTENGHTSDRLLFTYITVLPADKCKHFTNYNNVHLVYSPSWICSTPSQFMTCEGDSGGPLAIKNDDGSSDDVGHSYNLTLLWLDPLGRLQDFNELHVEESRIDVINHSKTLLKQPLTPGIWTAKLIGRTSIYAQLKFLVVPLAYANGAPLETVATAQSQNGGLGLSLPDDFELPVEWQQHLHNDDDVFALRQEALANSQLVGQQLNNHIDRLVGKFFQLRETCIVSEPAVLPELPLCQDTSWSSLALDPKSDIEALIKRR